MFQLPDSNNVPAGTLDGLYPTVETRGLYAERIVDRTCPHCGHELEDYFANADNWTIIQDFTCGYKENGSYCGNCTRIDETNDYVQCEHCYAWLSMYAQVWQRCGDNEQVYELRFTRVSERTYTLPPSLTDQAALRKDAAKRRQALSDAGCSTYTIGVRGGQPGIVCLCCGLGSSNPNDIAERYCGFCKAWHGLATEESTDAKPGRDTTALG